MSEENETVEMWAILEIMGHVRLAGRVTEEEKFGKAFCRIDIPTGEDEYITRYYGAESIYCLTPVSEQIARSAAAHNTPRPVYTYELPQLAAATEDEHPDLDDDDYDDGYDPHLEDDF